MALLNDENLAEARERLRLGRQSRILLFNTEGDTDPANFAEIIARQSSESLVDLFFDSRVNSIGWWNNGPIESKIDLRKYPQSHYLCSLASKRGLLNSPKEER